MKDDLASFKLEIQPIRKEASRAKILDVQVKTYKERIEKVTITL